MEKGTYTWKKATPQQMVDWVQAKIDVTPRYRILKRMQLRRIRKFWEGQLNDQ